MSEGQEGHIIEHFLLAVQEELVLNMASEAVLEAEVEAVFAARILEELQDSRSVAHNHIEFSDLTSLVKLPPN